LAELALVLVLLRLMPVQLPVSAIKPVAPKKNWIGWPWNLRASSASNTKGGQWPPYFPA
jgi:hypothetical protein